MTRQLSFLFSLTLLASIFPVKTEACTSVAVSRGASTDGSVFISWTYDVTGFMAPLQFFKVANMLMATRWTFTAFAKANHLAVLHKPNELIRWSAI